MKFITSNKNKIIEANNILGNIEGIKLELVEIQDVNVENVITYKIKEARKKITEDFIVEDTALYLGNNKEIGALIKFFSNRRIVKAYKKELAIATCAIGHSNGKIFLGEIKGKIVSPKGKNGFGWDCIFKPDGFNKTFAEMTNEEKNKISHRKIALEKLRIFL